MPLLCGISFRNREHKNEEIIKYSFISMYCLTMLYNRVGTVYKVHPMFKMCLYITNNSEEISLDLPKGI